MKTLIFPSDTKEARDYARIATQRGEEILTISGRELPRIHDQDFASRFLCIVEQNHPTHLFCPVASVYHFMLSFPHGLVLIGESPIAKQMRELEELLERTHALRPPTSAIPILEFAGMLKHASAIYGESNDEKLAAMMQVAQDAPKGKIVEIGSLCGRTAFLLYWLAAKFRIGDLITIDPWSAKHGVQEDSPPLLRSMTQAWNWTGVAELFYINMTPLIVSENFNHYHLRMPSSDVFKEAFDKTSISILHVDGNHDYKQVSKDVEDWIKYLIPGSWLILDDYEWAHGEGPRIVGDELLREKPHALHFVAGNALFMRF